MFDEKTTDTAEEVKAEEEAPKEAPEPVKAAGSEAHAPSEPEDDKAEE